MPLAVAGPSTLVGISNRNLGICPPWVFLSYDQLRASLLYVEMVVIDVETFTSVRGRIRGGGRGGCSTSVVVRPSCRRTRRPVLIGISMGRSSAVVVVARVVALSRPWPPSPAP